MTIARQVQSPAINAHFMDYVWKLLHLRWVLFLNGFRRSKTRQKFGTSAIIFIVIGLMIGAFVFSWWILSILTSPYLTRILGDPTPFLEAVPTLVFFMAFAGILITSFGVLLQALYLANDMDFLLSAPVPIRAVFVAKLLQAVIPNMGLVLLFGLPVLFGLGASQHYSLLYYPAVVVLLVLLTLSTAGLASLFVMSIVRIFPARRVAEVLAFIGAIFSFICGQSGQLFRFRGNNEQTIDAFNSIARINTPWLPLSWGGRSLVELGHGNWVIGSVAFLLILVLAGLIVWVTLVTAENLYYTGWATAQINPRKKKPQGASSTTSTHQKLHIVWIEQLIPAPVRAIVVKDFLVLRRDLRNLSQLITPLIFGMLYSFILLRDSPDSSTNGAAEKINILTTYGNTGIALFVGWMLLMRLALISFSQEGKNYWLLKIAPLTTQRLLIAKFLVAYIPSTVLGWCFLLVIGLLRNTNIWITIYGLIVLAFSFLGLSGVLLSFGVTGANLEWSDPRQMIRGNAGCVSSLVGMVYILICGSLFYAPILLGPSIGLPKLASGAIGLVLGGVLNVVCAYIPLQLVYHSVEQLGIS